MDGEQCPQRVHRVNNINFKGNSSTFDVVGDRIFLSIQLSNLSHILTEFKFKVDSYQIKTLSLF